MSKLLITLAIFCISTHSIAQRPLLRSDLKMTLFNKSSPSKKDYRAIRNGALNDGLLSDEYSLKMVVFHRGSASDTQGKRKKTIIPITVKKMHQ